MAGAAGVLFHDERDRVLLVEPTYKPHWEIPGGGMEGAESPAACCRREVREELGLDVVPGRLLVVDWAPDERGPYAAFVFDGGRLPADRERSIVLGDGELRSWRWVPPDGIGELVTPRLHRRLAAAIGAHAEITTWYTEQGVRP